MHGTDAERLFEAEALPHIDVLFRTAVRLAADRTEAEDLVQETYAQAWLSFGSYEAGTNCRAWLFKILMNKLEHQRRRRYALLKRTAEADAETLARTIAYVPPAGLELKDEEVLAALDRVPARFREVVLLADVEEFSYREIAEVLGVPAGTVMSRLSRGRKLLRGMLSGVAAGYGIGLKQYSDAAEYKVGRGEDGERGGERERKAQGLRGGALGVEVAGAAGAAA